MATAACGINCDICALKDVCGGCVPGTDPGARDRLAEIKKLFGVSCPVFKCAIEKNIDYCLRCPDFPCETHYKYNYPYSDLLLDNLRVMKERSSEIGSPAFHEELQGLARKYSKSGK